MTSSVVAAEVDLEFAMLAHVLLDLGDITHFGISLCGLPAEYLTIIHDLQWDDVAQPSRCQHCQQEWAAQA